MRRSSFNEFDRPRVVRDLRAHRRLWCGVVMDRLGSGQLIKLRDIDQDIWNVDTVYILSSRVDDAALTRLARRWHADDVSWLSHADTSDLLGESDPQHRRRVLLVWWD
jgi:hypothetical protein